MISICHRQDVAAAALLATLALALYSYRAAEPPETTIEKPLNAAVDLLTARGGRDDAGRLLPVFVRVSVGVSVTVAVSLAVAVAVRVTV